LTAFLPLLLLLVIDCGRFARLANPPIFIHSAQEV
jgi:hypothetical protein